MNTNDPDGAPAEVFSPVDSRAYRREHSPNFKDRFLKLKDVQDLLGVSRSTLWRWHAERGLKVVTVGAVTRIRASDLEAFLKRHESNSPPDPVTQNGECANPSPAR